MVPYRCMNQLSIRQLQNHGMLHVLPVLLDIIIGDGISATPIAMIPSHNTNAVSPVPFPDAMRRKQGTVTTTSYCEPHCQIVHKARLCTTPGVIDSKDWFEVENYLRPFSN